MSHDYGFRPNFSYKWHVVPLLIKCVHKLRGKGTFETSHVIHTVVKYAGAAGQIKALTFAGV